MVRREPIEPSTLTTFKGLTSLPAAAWVISARRAFGAAASEATIGLPTTPPDACVPRPRSERTDISLCSEDSARRCPTTGGTVGAGDGAGTATAFPVEA